jgi:hypothetical protein
MNFKINQKIEVILDRERYYDPKDISREVDLLDKSSMEKQLLGLSKPSDFTRNHKDNLYEEKGIASLTSVKGKYVGGRPGLIKVKPEENLLTDRFSEYFIIPEFNISEIKEL